MVVVMSTWKGISSLTEVVTIIADAIRTCNDVLHTDGCSCPCWSLSCGFRMPLSTKRSALDLYLGVWYGRAL